MEGGVLDARPVAEGSVMTVATDEKEVARFRESIDALVERMKQVVVDSQEKYDFLNAWIRENKETQKAVDALFEVERVAKKGQYDDVLSRKAALKRPLEVADKVARERMGAWATEQERKRREEEARAREAIKATKEDDKLLQAEELASMGRVDQALEVLDKGVRVGKVETETQKVGKVQEYWTVTVTDLPAFLSEAVGIPALLAVVSVDLVALAKLAQADKGVLLSKVPGVTAEQKFRPVL